MCFKTNIASWKSPIQGGEIKRTLQNRERIRFYYNLE